MKILDPKTPSDQPSYGPATAERDSESIPDIQLVELFEGRQGGDTDPIAEILRIHAEISPDKDPSFLAKTSDDLTAIFQGRYKGFRYSDVKYHDLRHTRLVVLAAARLLHGLHLQGRGLRQDIHELCLICAYFHDTGMLLTTDDSASVGSAYLQSHEERSATIARQYLIDNKHLSDISPSCLPIINCTNLTIAPETIRFADDELRMAGSVLGTADILAQMADRYYLESLPLLYQEQKDAGIDLHQSSLALMRQTTTFYHEVIEHRLYTSFDSVCDLMPPHFRQRWTLDRNIYMERISGNIKYLEYVVERHDQALGEISDYLRRRPRNS